MGLRDSEEPMNDKDGGGLSYSAPSQISCSICLEPVKENEGRSYAKLQCGHEFHLDCIGSAFNVKGAMQCPNCRKTEKGQWLYANGSHSSSNEFSLVDWPHEEDLYDLSYAEMPFGVHWRCPFSGMPRFSSSFEEGESPLTAFHDLLGHEAMFAEHHWNHLFAASDISRSHAFSNVDPHYRVWDPSPPFSAPSNQNGGTDPDSGFPTVLRTLRGDSDAAQRSGSILHPFVHNRGSGSRAGSSVAASMMAPYPTADHDRVEGPHPFHHRRQFLSPSIWSPLYSNNVRRSGGSRTMAPAAGPPPPFSEHASGVYALPPSGSSGRNIHEAVNPVRSQFYAWERDRFTPFPLVPMDRDPGWWAMGTAAGGSDYGNRVSSHRQRHGSDRAPIRPVQSGPDNPSYPVPPGHPFV